MQYVSAVFNNIYNVFCCRNFSEETYEVQIKHGGNQLIDEFYEKKENGSPNYNKKKRNPMTIHIGKSKTILDVKKNIKIKKADGSYLSVFNNNGGNNFHLKPSVFGKVYANECPLELITDVEKIENNIIKLFIVIPHW